MLDMETLAAIAREAGNAAVAFFGRTITERKADGSLVTQADRAAQDIIVQAVRERIPDPRQVFLLGEESLDDDPNPGVAESLDAEWTVCIDPVDGTTRFAAGIPVWAVSIGLLREGRPVAGVVHAPLMGGSDGWTFATDVAGQAFLNNAPLPKLTDSPWHSHSQLIVSTTTIKDAYHRVFPGKILSYGATAIDGSLVACGAVQVAVITHPCIWDLAGCVPVVERVGGVARTARGQEIDWPSLREGRRHVEPVIMGHPDAVDRARDLFWPDGWEGVTQEPSAT